MEKYKFKGWDYLELAECWNIDIPEDMDDDWKPIEEFIERMMGDITKEEDFEYIHKIAEDLREYLRTLSNDPDCYYIGGVWKAISEIRDDYSLFRISIPLIAYMWS